MTPAAHRLILESLWAEHDRKARRLEEYGSGAGRRVAADSIRWALDQLQEPPPKIWVARCEVCNSQWTVDGEHNPNPKGMFCPDCRSYGRAAPGILNWEPG